MLLGQSGPGLVWVIQAVASGAKFKGGSYIPTTQTLLLQPNPGPVRVHLYVKFWDFCHCRFLALILNCIKNYIKIFLKKQGYLVPPHISHLKEMLHSPHPDFGSKAHLANQERRLIKHLCLAQSHMSSPCKRFQTQKNLSLKSHFFQPICCLSNKLIYYCHLGRWDHQTTWWYSKQKYPLKDNVSNRIGAKIEDRLLNLFRQL